MMQGGGTGEENGVRSSECDGERHANGDWWAVVVKKKMVRWRTMFWMVKKISRIKETKPRR